MKVNLDLNDFSGGPHWLSGHGKVDRDRIRRKHRAAHHKMLDANRVITPALPETRARLEDVIARSRVKATGALQKAPTKLKIHGHELASWARAICHQDAQRIPTAISVGLTAGEGNTDIAHRVLGSRRNNGTDGMTEITRQHIYRLGHGLLQVRKSRMGGHSSDV